MPGIPHPFRRPLLIGLALVFALIVAPIVILRSFQRKQIELPHVPHVPPAPVGMMPLPYAFIPSPNADLRPPGATVNCVVLHATVLPTLSKTVAGFLDRNTHVSAHFVVGKDGRVVQMVRVEKRAWHAGISTLDGSPHVNDFSVGIEIVNRNNGRDAYPHVQVEAVAGIIRFLRSRFDIPDSRIVSHEAIALPPGRKSDPRNLNFALIRRLSVANAGT